MPRVVELPVQTVLTVVCEQVASGVGGASGTDVSSVSGGVSGMAGASPTVKREEVRTTVDPRTGAHVTERALFYQEEPKQSTFQQQVSPPTAAAQQPTFQQVQPQSTRLVVARHRDIWTEPAPLMRYGISAPGAKQLFGRVAAKAMQMWGW